ncbi:MAG: DUF1214 domain-containing protein [Sphingopyxis sp.]
MKRWLGWAIAIIIGLVGGAALAVAQMRHRGLGDDIRIGPWTTARDIGTATTDARTRAVVALRGLLALPTSEARYFTASVDSSGRALSGKCSYTLSGGTIAARWWSVTLYDTGGWLIVNRWNKHSVGSAAFPSEQQSDWRIAISPTEQAGAWIPTATSDAFELTLRTYRPRGQLARDPARVTLPTIIRTQCTP